MRKEIEKLRLKTRMSEAFTATKLPYPTQREYAINQLSALQEEYKALTGEYLKEFVYEAANAPKDPEAKEAIWTIQHARRKDGKEVKIGSKYKDGNNKTYTISEMYVTDNGKLIGLAKEGGFIDLAVVDII